MEKRTDEIYLFSFFIFERRTLMEIRAPTIKNGYLNTKLKSKGEQYEFQRKSKKTIK